MPILRRSSSSLILQSTTYDTYTAPRVVDGRRNLALVHPLAQLGLSLLITKHRQRIKEIIGRGGTSLYRTEEGIKNGRAFVGLDFRKWDAIKARLSSESSYILKADISRFFYTAYTHSIPWAILGKERVKEWLADKQKKKKLRAHWSNDFDTALQSCQSRETFGIPVGPDTSRIVAEILLAGVEADGVFASSVHGRPAFRLLDDFMIGFDEEIEARKALGALRSALWKYNLQLNDQKTAVVHSKAVFLDRWKLEFDAIAISDGDSSRQERDIYRLVDLTLHFCSEAGTGTPAIWACHRLSRLAIAKDNFTIILDALCRLARDFPACISHVAAFFINHQSACREVGARERVEKWIRSTLRTHSQQYHHFEVAWSLLVSGVLHISISADDLGKLDRRPNSVVLAILGMLHERNLLSKPLPRLDWRALFKQTGMYGENWLPCYEAVKRQWTKDKKLIAAMSNDPIFGKMLAAGVTFLEDRILEARQINIVRRTFKKARRQSTGEAMTQPYTGEEDNAEDQNDFAVSLAGYDF
jgi:hypothetical protein